MIECLLFSRRKSKTYGSILPLKILAGY